MVVFGGGAGVGIVDVFSGEGKNIHAERLGGRNEANQEKGFERASSLGVRTGLAWVEVSSVSRRERARRGLCIVRCGGG
jgi:hypothetical protein